MSLKTIERRLDRLDYRNTWLQQIPDPSQAWQWEIKIGGDRI